MYTPLHPILYSKIGVYRGISFFSSSAGAEGSGYSWSGVRPSVDVVNNFKHHQTACPIKAKFYMEPMGNESLGERKFRGNESFFAACGSNDQDGRHAHIWLKPFNNLLLQNRQADFHETWYVASGTPAHHSLFK